MLAKYRVLMKVVKAIGFAVRIECNRSFTLPSRKNYMYDNNVGPFAILTRAFCYDLPLLTFNLCKCTFILLFARKNGFWKLNLLKLYLGQLTKEFVKDYVLKC